MVNCEVVVVGGGAAGIAAARRLADRGRSVLIVEALDRLGGRAHTRRVAGLPLDLGCGWLHSADRNPLAGVAEATGRRIDRSEAAWGKQLRNLGFSAADRETAWNSYAAWEQRLRDDPPHDDRAGAVFPRDAPYRAFADALSGFVNGAGIDDLSAADFLAYEDASTEFNWRLPEGYGAFIAALGAELPHRLATRVTAIDPRGPVRVETDAGTIAAKAAIVTVPTTILARGDIRFGCDIADHLHAAACLPLGLADKVFLAVADPGAIPPESHLLGAIDQVETGSYYLRPFGWPVIECFLGGAWAHSLEQAGEAAACDFVVGELRALLGARFAAGLRPLATSRWAAEPTIGGSYSHALPGHRGARAVLARPPHPLLHFAGEACSPHDFSTAHGAWASGLAAADAVETALTD